MPHSAPLSTEWQHQLNEHGYVIAAGVFRDQEALRILSQVEAAIQSDQAGSTLRAGAGSVYGARNVLELWPSIKDVWRQPPLPELLRTELGPEFGLVRTLYFDKPPEKSWALP